MKPAVGKAALMALSLALIVCITPAVAIDAAVSAGPDPEAPEFASAMIELAEQIEAQVCGLPFVVDGTFTADGTFVYTATRRPQTVAEPGLNCTGFSKAVADHLHRRLFGTDLGLQIDDLEHRYLDLRTNPEMAAYEFELDPFYGQDWVRNIARVLNRHRELGRGAWAKKDLPGEAWDITEIPGVPYEPRWGFPGAHMDEIFDHLADELPGHVFFFAVAKHINPDVEILQYAHTGAFITVRQTDGERLDYIFESNVRNPFSGFAWRNQHRYIFLVGVDVASLL